MAIIKFVPSINPAVECQFLSLITYQILFTCRVESSRISDLVSFLSFISFLIVHKLRYADLECVITSKDRKE